MATGTEAEGYLSCSMYSDCRMMSQTSTGYTLIGFCYLELYLNPKLSAANLNVDLTAHLGNGKELTRIPHLKRESRAGACLLKGGGEKVCCCCCC